MFVYQLTLPGERGSLNDVNLSGAKPQMNPLLKVQNPQTCFQTGNGLVKAINGIDFTMDHCVFLAAGDLIEFVVYGMSTVEEIVPGCMQIIASGDATADGRLYHARLMDWLQLDFVIEKWTALSSV